MKNLILLIIFICFYSTAISQETKKINSGELLRELATNACKCIDSINTYNKSRAEVTAEINKCLDTQAGAYQMGAKIMDIGEITDQEVKDGKKQVNITVNTNKNSADYKKYYYQLEKYMMSNCTSLKEKLANDEKQSEKSVSQNPKAVEFYSKGIEEAKNNKYKNAIKYFKKAVKEDPEFAFAWDNLGINYRRMNQFDKAIEAYKKSIKIDATGKMPLQNIAVAYQYKENYKGAIEAYKKLAQLDQNNPEVFYGIGNIYATKMEEYEKGLNYMCKAYTLYIQQKSPYRTDAEQVIKYIYAKMKEQGQLEKFNDILKENNINPN